MRRSIFGTIVVVAVIVLSAVGVDVSAKLTERSILHGTSSKSTISKFFADVCGEEEGSNVSCDKVTASRWGVFPPRPKEGEYKGAGIPISIFGTAYCTFVLAWFLGVGRSSYNRRFWHVVPVVVTTGGLGASLFLSYIMFFQLSVWCPWCAACHAVNLLLWVGTLILWPRKLPVAEGGLSKVDAPISEVVPKPAHSRPSVRVALLTVAMGAALIWGEWKATVNLVGNYNMNMMYRQMQRYRPDAQALLQRFFRQEKKDIPIRTDDPVRGTPDPCKLVVLSDFGCPSCAFFAKQLEEDILPMFDGTLAVYFKHNPLNRTCNPHQPQNLYPYSCDAARAAIAAHLQGGNEAFWKMHDVLFENGQRLDEFPYAELAEQISLDGARLLADMKSEAVTEWLKEDTELTRELECNSTPVLYLDGRRVDSLAHADLDFWKNLATAAKKAREAKRSRRQ